jgi:hypothetical protein
MARHFQIYKVLIHSMKKQTIQHTIEEIAKKHLGVGDITVTDLRNVSVLSLKVALTEALKAGEKLGYAEGYSNAKTGCEAPACECEYSFYP